jgi:hypothetical protein
VYFLHSHLDLFPEIIEKASDEQGEYHINRTPLSRFLERFVIADYCWMFYRDTPDIVQSRERKSSHF